jgi:hypothetical protein
MEKDHLKTWKMVGLGIALKNMTIQRWDKIGSGKNRLVQYLDVQIQRQFKVHDTSRTI